MFSQILAAIAAIPKLLDAIRSLIAYFKKAEDERWFAQKVAAFQDLDNAQTLEEYKAASKKINDVLRGL
jgi:hypothetical protein